MRLMLFMLVLGALVPSGTAQSLTVSDLPSEVRDVRLIVDGELFHPPFVEPEIRSDGVYYGDHRIYVPPEVPVYPTTAPSEVRDFHDLGNVAALRVLEARSRGVAESLLVNEFAASFADHPELVTSVTPLNHTTLLVVRPGADTCFVALPPLQRPVPSAATHMERFVQTFQQTLQNGDLVIISGNGQRYQSVAPKRVANTLQEVARALHMTPDEVDRTEWRGKLCKRTAREIAVHASASR